MKKVILRPVTGGQKVVELKIGKTTIGRGPLLECSDKKVSRNHAVLEVTEDGDVLITPTHVNPCFYQAQGRGPSKVMKKDKQHPLSPGDSISLLPNNYKYVVQVTSGLGNSPGSGLQDSNGDQKPEVDGRETAGTKEAVDDAGGEEESALEAENGDGSGEGSPESGSRPTRKSPSHEGGRIERTVSRSARSRTAEHGGKQHGERTLPQWLLDSAAAKGAASDATVPKKERADRTAAKKPPKRQARPRYTFSESEPDADDDDDDFVAGERGKVEDGGNLEGDGSKVDARRRSGGSGGREERSGGRASRKNRGTMQKISLDDFVASDDDEWQNSSEETRPRRRQVEDSGSDWEEENRRSKRRKRYPSSDSDSASDWERGGRRKKPATRVRSRRRKNSSEESEASEEELPPRRGTRSRKKRDACKYGSRCYRRSAQHKKQYSHPGDSDYGGEEPEEERESEGGKEEDGNDEAKEESEGENDRPVCQYGADCYRRNELHRRNFKHPAVPERSTRRERDETKGERNRGEKADEKTASGDEYEWKDEEEGVTEDLREEARGFARRRRRRQRHDAPDD